MLACLVAVLPAGAQLYTHEVLLRGVLAFQGGAALNNRGDWACGVIWPGAEAETVYLNGVDYAHQVPGLRWAMFRDLGEGGDVAFCGGGDFRDGLKSAFVNMTNISELVPGSYGEDEPSAVNANGDVVWFRYEGGVGYTIYKNTTELTHPAAHHGAWITDINDDGQAIWGAWNIPLDRLELFIDDTWVTEGLLPEFWTFSQGLIANNGTWAAQGELREPKITRLIKNGVDLSAIVWGEDALTHVETVDITPNGSVLWKGSSLDIGYGQLFVDTVDISTPVVGTIASVYGGAINSSGSVVWRGATSSTRAGIYVDGYNLTQDAFGPDFWTWAGAVRAFDINDSGQVLWAFDEGDDSWTLYLSTPIPEPGTALALIFGVALLCVATRRRRQAAETSLRS
jgi:hypothetical protein